MEQDRAEIERLRREVDELKSASEIERSMHDQQCENLARQNDWLIKQRDDAIKSASRTAD